MVVNAPDLDSVPADDLNILPYTFPPDIIPTPGVPLGSGGNGGSGYNGGSNPGPDFSEPKTQLQRDINYVRGTVGYNPTPYPVTNATTPKPEMPGWKINADLIPEIAIATAMLATSAVAARFLTGETNELKNNFDKWVVKHLGYKDPGIKQMVLYVISIGLFALDPGLVDGILLFVGMFGFFFDFIAATMYSGAMDYFGYLLLAVAIIKLVKKFWGLDVVQMASDKLSKLKEIFTNELGPTFDRLKEMFGLK